MRALFGSLPIPISILILPIFLFGPPVHASSVFLYGGAATNAPLLDIIKAKVPSFEPYSAFSFGLARRILRSERHFALDAEAVLTRYLERVDAFSIGASVMARLIEPPWHRTLPGSLGFGVGWSWASVVPEVEERSIAVTARGLLLVQMEFEFDLGRSDWSVFLRDQHRSGIFGLIGGVVGGSDYICLGLRRRFL